MPVCYDAHMRAIGCVRDRRMRAAAGCYDAHMRAIGCVRDRRMRAAAAGAIGHGDGRLRGGGRCTIRPPSPPTVEGASMRPIANVLVLAGFVCVATSARADVGGAIASPWDDTKPISPDDSRRHYAVGMRGRLLMVPGWMLDGFLTEHTDLTSGATGLEFIVRKGPLDIVTSLDVSFFSMGAGNFLASGKDPRLDTHYVDFRGLSLLSVDVTFVYRTAVTRWAEFLIGGGVGLGLLLGDVWLINNSDQVCTVDNVKDPSKCHPISGDTYTDASGQARPIGPIKPGDPDFERKLEATAASQAACNKANVDGTLDCRDTALHPHWHAAPEKPPVMVVLNFILGIRFKVNRHLNINVTGGFRDGWVVGAGPEYVF
jgi:hypothetical protein